MSKLQMSARPVMQQGESHLRRMGAALTCSTVAYLWIFWMKAGTVSPSSSACFHLTSRSCSISWICSPLHPSAMMHLEVELTLSGIYLTQLIWLPRSSLGAAQRMAVARQSRRTCLLALELSMGLTNPMCRNCWDVECEGPTSREFPGQTSIPHVQEAATGSDSLALPY